jgi:proteasome-associated ATPase
VKIKIERPDAEAARDIFSKYLTDRPAAARGRPRSSGGDAAKAVRGDDRAHRRADVHRDEENRFLEVTYANGDKEVLYFKDFNSGAMIENIVAGPRRWRSRTPRPRQKGIRLSTCSQAMRRRVQGERGPAQHHQPRRLGEDLGQEGRADRLHPHAHHRQAGHRAGRSIDTVANTGQYRPASS